MNFRILDWPWAALCYKNVLTNSHHNIFKGNCIILLVRDQVRSVSHSSRVIVNMRIPFEVMIVYYQVSRRPGALILAANDSYDYIRSQWRQLNTRHVQHLGCDVFSVDLRQKLTIKISNLNYSSHLNRRTKDIFE